jgi:hypothetical protein
MKEPFSEKMNSKFDIPLEKLEEEIHAKINGNLEGYSRIIPPRDFRTVNTMTFMRKEVFNNLIRHIPLRENSEELPYHNSEIRVFGREPKGALVGQTFVLESKLISIMRGLERGIFGDFIVKGISKMPPVQIYGTDCNGQKAIGFYLPPIVEVHSDEAIIIDGMHRSRLCGGAGTTINAIHISRVGVPLPFKPVEWNEVEIVSEKPSIEQRYKQLNKKYFRDLGAVGIDG